jgi:hypothetical protein
MTSGRAVVLSLLGWFLLAPLVAGQEEARGDAAPRPSAAKKAAGQNNQPGVQALQRLAQMTPEERQKALANLPPQRRQEILEKFREFQDMPPTAKQRATLEVERLQSLPQPRQNQVRRSLQQFRALPDERKATIRRELGRLSAMPEEDRRARMNSEEFRNRYSPAEQQMIGNLSELVAPND